MWEIGNLRPGSLVGWSSSSESAVLHQNKEQDVNGGAGLGRTCRRWRSTGVKATALFPQEGPACLHAFFKWFVKNIFPSSQTPESLKYVSLKYVSVLCSTSCLEWEALIIGGFAIWPTASFTSGASQVALVVKNLPASAGDIRGKGLIPGLGRSLRGGHGNPLQHSCLENRMDRRAWQATFHKVAKSRTQL